MINVDTAVKHLETIFLDEFKSACFDRPNRPELILDLHKYFKYQTRIYTFSVEDHIPRIYNELRQARISTEENKAGDDISYPLTFLTELSQRLIVLLATDAVIETEDGLIHMEPEIILDHIARETAQLMVLHGQEQTYIVDKYYQATITADTWVEILNVNPWLLVGILLRFTGYELTEALYVHRVNNAEMLKELVVV